MLFPWQGATGVIQTALGVLMVVVLSWTWPPRRRWTVLLALVGATVVGLLGVWGANAVL